MMIMDPLTVGTLQGIMTVEATVSARGKGHQVTPMIIMAAGMTKLEKVIVQNFKNILSDNSVLARILHT